MKTAKVEKVYMQSKSAKVIKLRYLLLLATFTEVYFKS